MEFLVRRGLGVRLGSSTPPGPPRSSQRRRAATYIAAVGIATTIGACDYPEPVPGERVSISSNPWAVTAFDGEAVAARITVAFPDHARIDSACTTIRSELLVDTSGEAIGFLEPTREAKSCSSADRETTDPVVDALLASDSWRALDSGLIELISPEHTVTLRPEPYRGGN